MFHLMVPRRNRMMGFERANPLGFFRDEADRLFNPFFEGWLAPVVDVCKPTWGFDVEETGKEVVYRTEMPGFEIPEIHVHVVGDVLGIRAEHREEAKGKGPNGAPARRTVERSVTLPPGTDPEKLTATYRNGLLEVRLPRVPEAEPRRIEVKT